MPSSPNPPTLVLPSPPLLTPPPLLPLPQHSKRRIVVDLPIPESTIVDGYTQDLAARNSSAGNKFVLTRAYVRRPAKGLAFEDPEYVDYDLEYSDEMWLRANAKIGIAAAQQAIADGDGGAGAGASSSSSASASASSSSSGGAASASGVAPVTAGEPLLPARTFERMLDLLEKYNGERAHGTLDVIPQAEAETMLGDALKRSAARFPLPEVLAAGSPGFSRCAAEVYAFWTGKRAKLKKPLLRRFWAPTSSTDNNPHHTFRPHEKQGYKLRRTRRNDTEAFKKLKALQTDMLTAMTLLQTVREREAIKRDLVAVRADVCDQTLFELVTTSGEKRTPSTLALLRERIKRKDGEGGGGVRNPLRIKIKQPNRLFDGSSGAGGAGGGVGGQGGDKKLAQNMGPGGLQKKPGTPYLVPGAGGAAGGGQGGQGGPPKLKKPSQGPQTEEERRRAQLLKRQREALSAPASQQSVPARPPHASYPGFRLGPWQPLASLHVNQSFMHLEESAFEPEDPLDLSRAYGLRLGVVNSRAARQASVRNQPYDVLPSGSSSFPMDKAADRGGLYDVPADPGLYYGDVSVQRRMIILKNSVGLHGGATAWEEGLGTGLVAGLGGSVAPDGSNWHWIGSRLEASVLPLDEVDGGAASGMGPSAAKTARGGGDGEAAASSSSSGTLAAQLARSAAASAAAREPLSEAFNAPGLGKPASFAARRAALLAAKKAAGAMDAEGDDEAADEDDEEDEDGDDEADIILRPRVGRGGRLLFDRVRAAPDRPELEEGLRDSLRLLHKRRAVLADQRASALSQWVSGSAVGAAGAADDKAAAGRLAQAAPTAMTLPALYRAAVEPTRRFGMASGSGRSVGGSVRGGPAGDDGMAGDTIMASRVGGVSTAYTLAPVDRNATGSAAAAVGAFPPTSSSAASLFAPELDEILAGLIGGGGGGGSGSGPAKGSAAAAGTAKTGAGRGASEPATPVPRWAASDVSSSSSSSGGGPHLGLLGPAAAPSSLPAETILLKVAALRFAAGLDSAPAIPKNMPRRAVVPTGPVTDTRWGDIWAGENDSDDDELVRDEAAGPAVGAGVDASGAAWSATLDGLLRGVPLGPAMTTA